MDRLSFATRAELWHFEDLGTPIWVFDVDRHRMWWANNHALKFWKADTLDALVRRDFSGDSQSVRRRLRQIISAATTRGAIQETWTVYPSGEPVCAHLSFQAVYLENDQNGVLIELHRTIEEGLDDDAWRVMEAARASSLLVSTFTLDGQLLAQNPACTEAYGSHEKPARGNTDLTNRFADAKLVNQVLARVADDESFSLEVEVCTHRGQRTHLVSARRGRDPITGHFVAVLSEEDITELALLRRQQQSKTRMLEGTIAERTDRLRASEERYALAVQTAAIWDWDIVTNHLFLSPSFVSSLGFDSDEFRETLRETTLAGLIHPDDVDGYRQAMEQHLALPDQPISHELRFLTKDGGARWYHSQGKFMLGADGEAIRAVGLLTDITQRKELEASLMASQRLEAIGQLTGGIAHDFNNLLTVIQGNAQLLQELQIGDPELTEEIVKAVQRGAELTRHLLAFARQQTLNPRSVRLDGLMSNMRKTILRALTENVQVGLDVPPTIWPVYADPSQIEAALLNIAINARDAMPIGGRLLLTCRNRTFSSSAQVRGLEMEPGQYVEIAVSDSGDGMTPETLSKAFEPFFTTKEVGRGSGLGLSMVLGFSRQSGGDTQIISRPGLGTTVTMYLPRALQSARTDRPGNGGPLSFGQGELIHVLEDNPNVQQTLSKMLQSLGYSVTCSDTVDAALTLSRTQPKPRLVLADVILPGGKSGVDFARTMRRLEPDVRVILMSGYPNTHLAKDAVGDLASAFLTKPIDKAILSQAICSALTLETHSL